MTTTFYMVECAFPFPEERAGFDEFYQKHITMLLSIEGFRTAQRFEATHEARAPFMAIYELEAPDVLQRPTYTARAGPTSVSETYRPKMLNWDRNVVTGPTLDLDVPEDGWLVMVDRKAHDAPPLPDGFAAFVPAAQGRALDQTVVERGVKFGTGTPIFPEETAGWIVRSMRPLHPRRTP
jgi:hypothetical protein